MLVLPNFGVPLIPPLIGLKVNPGEIAGLMFHVFAPKPPGLVNGINEPVGTVAVNVLDAEIGFNSTMLGKYARCKLEAPCKSK